MYVYELKMRILFAYKADHTSLALKSAFIESYRFLCFLVSLVLYLGSWALAKQNGVASYRKLKTCNNLRLRLAMTCVYLR